jgi:hypothetical protein
MVNKKIAIVLALAALGLAGCGNNTSSKTATTSDGGTTSAPSADVPVVEGKYTLYFHFKASDMVASIPDINSPFITGAAWNWGTTPYDAETKKGAMPFVALANTDIWYLQVDKALFEDVDGKFDATKRGYQITLGWNTASNAPADQQGIDWTYKADYNALYPGASHPLMDAPDAKGIVDIYGATAVIANPDVPDETSDEHWMADPTTKVDYLTFSATKPAPKKLLNRSIKFKINDLDGAATPVSKPTWVKDFYATGAYDTWSGAFDDAHKLTVDADGYYTIKLGDVYGGVNIEYMVVCTTVDDNGNVAEEGFWTNKAQSDNLSYKPLAVDGDNFVDTVDPLTWTAWPEKPAVKFDCTIDVTVSDYVADATIDGVYVKGSYNGWADGKKMTADDAKVGHFTISFKMAPSAEGKPWEIGFYTGLAGKQVAWFSKVGGGNITFEFAKAGTLTFTGSIAAGVVLA